MTDRPPPRMVPMDEIPIAQRKLTILHIVPHLGFAIDAGYLHLTEGFPHEDAPLVSAWWPALGIDAFKHREAPSFVFVDGRTWSSASSLNLDIRSAVTKIRINWESMGTVWIEA